MPIQNPDDATQLDRHLTRFFEVNDSERANVLRQMFVSEMDFESARGIVPLQPFPSQMMLPKSCELIASAEGFNVMYVGLDIAETDQVRKGEAVQVAKRIEEALGPDMLLVLTNTSRTQLHFIYPTFETAIPTLRRIIIERYLPRRTAVQQLSNCYFEWQDKTLRQALDSAYNVEAVTERFFEEYRIVFAEVDNLVKGFGDDKDELEARHIFTQNLFNRLMFVYFISRKGWLTFGGDNEYLAAIWSSHIASNSKNSFFCERIKKLFSCGLNRDQSAYVYEDANEVNSLIGKVPFLNGGLFDEIDAERNRTIDISDEAMSHIVGPTGLLERFNFTVMESTPYDVEVAVDPEMLGKVFEELVTDRHSSGAYYTPRPVVSFMCREALKGHLYDRIAGASNDEIAKFVDQHDPSGLLIDQAQQISEALAEVRVIDPACGSGAYLLGMMQELIDLSITLFSSDLEINAKTLYDLKLHIIERNLYGVDVDDFAVNIAMLRLWLSLAIDFEGEAPEPLPNLDFKIIVGDSLTGPNPTEPGQIELFEPQVNEIAAEIAELKTEFLEMWGDEKETLKAEIAEREAQLLELQTYSTVPANAINWRTKFVEVFTSNDGFDIALANPPYVRFQLIPKSLKAILKTHYPDALTGQSDLYVSFFARAVQILRNRGVHVFICSNSWLDSDFGIPLQKYLLKVAHIKAIYDSEVERQFSTAAINTVISVIQCQSESNVDTRFISFTAPFELAERNLQQLDMSDKAAYAEGIQYRLVDLANNPVSNSFGAGKWGSHFLRSPSVWQTLGDQIGGNLSLLNEVFSVDSYMILPKKADQVIVLRLDSIPTNVSEYFVPFVRSPRYHDQPLINTSEFAILVATESDVAQSQTLSAFIDECEYRLDSEFNAPPQKDNWFVVKQTPGKILWQRRFGERHTIFLNPNGFLSYDFYRLVNHNMTTPDDNLRAAATLLNSFTWLGKEILGRVSLGEGALKTEGSDVQKIPILPLNLVPDAALVEAESILNRPADPPAQEFNSPDRQNLDRLIAEAMGLSASKVDETYNGIERLVRRRFTKASSVTK